MITPKFITRLLEIYNKAEDTAKKDMHEDLAKVIDKLHTIYVHAKFLVDTSGRYNTEMAMRELAEAIRTAEKV